MSRDLGRDVPDLENLDARKLWADFSYPKFLVSAKNSFDTFHAAPIFRDLLGGSDKSSTIACWTAMEVPGTLNRRGPLKGSGVQS